MIGPRNAIEAVDLTKYYGSLLAVDHVSFQVREGELFGFLGPNGAGKTTTVRMLTTLLTPSDGTAVIQGTDILADPYGARENVGVVPETSNVYQELSAWHNMVFSAEIYGVPRRKRDRRAQELLELVGLWDRSRAKASDLSKGMRRRLTIAMAMVHEPAVLFLDEPTSGLDVQSSILIRSLMRKFCDDGSTVFLTTHQMEEADQMCDRVAIINKGRIACIDTPENLRHTIQEIRSLVLRFSRTDDSLVQDLASLTGVTEVNRAGEEVRLFTRDPGSLVPLVADVTRVHGTRLISVNTAAPTLEEVFLKVTEPEDESPRGADEDEPA